MTDSLREINKFSELLSLIFLEAFLQFNHPVFQIQFISTEVLAKKVIFFDSFSFIGVTYSLVQIKSLCHSLRLGYVSCHI